MGDEQQSRLGAEIPCIEAVFDRLDAWRHFPAYQLERRADIFFSLYLREVIEQERSVELLDAIVPEIPIKHQHSAQSFKADYLLCSTERTRVFLVELKTDPRSRREEQDAYLSEAAAAGMTALLEGIRAIVNATHQRRKYYHLLRELAALGLLHLPGDIETHFFAESQRGLARAFRQIKVADVTPSIEVLFVQPLPTNDTNHLDFERFASYVKRHPDPLSQRFSESLLRWRSAAGEREVQHELSKVHV